MQRSSGVRRSGHARFPVLFSALLLTGTMTSTTARADEAPRLTLGLSAALLRASVHDLEAANGQQVESSAQGGFHGVVVSPG